MLNVKTYYLDKTCGFKQVSAQKLFIRIFYPFICSTTNPNSNKILQDIKPIIYNARNKKN